MKKYDLAIVSRATGDVSGILSIWAVNIKEALKRARNDPDMLGVHVYPYNAGQQQRFVKAEADNSNVEDAVASLA